MPSHVNGANSQRIINSNPRHRSRSESVATWSAAFCGFRACGVPARAATSVPDAPLADSLPQSIGSDGPWMRKRTQRQVCPSHSLSVMRSWVAYTPGVKDHRALQVRGGTGGRTWQCPLGQLARSLPPGQVALKAAHGPERRVNGRTPEEGGNLVGHLRQGHHGGGMVCGGMSEPSKAVSAS